MSWENFEAFYASALQSPWLLLVGPVAFLLWRAVARAPGPGAAPAHAGFVAAWCIGFAIETIVDPLSTGPLVRALGLTGLAAQVVMLLFVLLGDLRIWWLVFHLAAPGPAALGRALLPTVAIPVFAYALTALAGALAGDIAGQWLWLAHEATYCAAALWLRARWLPTRVHDAATRELLAAVLLYSAVYYALWATADVLILAGLDFGWAVRVIPNQLYYAWTVPFVWWRCFAARYAVTSTSTQASR